MKRKIFSLILAICLIIPAMFILSACGNAKPEEPTITTTVTEEQWGKAVGFEGMKDITLNSTINTNPNFSYQLKYDGVTVYSKQIGMHNNPASTEHDESYYTKITSGDTVSYVKYYWVTTDQKWKNEESDETSYNGALAHLNNLGQGFPYNEYTYNENTKAYVHTETSPAQTNELYFENGVLVKILIINGTSTLRFDLSYSPLTLTLPTVA